MSVVQPPVAAPMLFRYAAASIKGMLDKGVPPTYLRVHPEDWRAMVAYSRKITGRGSRSKPKLELFGVPVRLSDEQERGDIRSFFDI